MAKLVFYTQSYNNEKTIVSTMESVLGQTMGDFVYYVADDCSTDGTVAAIREVAQGDPRVQVIERETNGYMQTHHYTMAKILEEHPEALYFAQLDGDDWYREDFAEFCVNKMDQGADVAVCSSNVVRRMPGGKLATIAQRVWIEEDTFLDVNGILREFRWLHPLLRTIWAKMYRLDLIREHHLQHPDMIIAGDTVFAYNYLRHVQKLYVTKELLHIYYSHDTSQSFRYDPKRHESIGVMKQVQLETLKQMNNLLEENGNFIRVACLNDIVEAMDVDVKQLVAQKPLNGSFSKVMQDPVLVDGWQLIKDPVHLAHIYHDNTKAAEKTIDRVHDRLIRQATALFQGGCKEEARQMLEFMQPDIATYWQDSTTGELLSSPIFQAFLRGELEDGPARPAKTRFDMALYAYMGAQKGDWAPVKAYLEKYGGKVPVAQRIFIARLHPVLQRVEGAEAVLGQPEVVKLVFSGQYEALLDDLPARVPALAEQDPQTALALARLGQFVASLLEQDGHYLFFVKAEMELLLVTGRREAFLPLWQQWDPLLPGDEEMRILYDLYLGQGG